MIFKGGGMGNREFWLTEREREVVELVSNGLSAKEIGSSLSIATSTVERHIDNVRIKTRARNRPHMVALVLCSGVLDRLQPHPKYA